MRELRVSLNYCSSSNPSVLHTILLGLAHLLNDAIIRRRADCFALPWDYIRIDKVALVYIYRFNLCPFSAPQFKGAPICCVMTAYFSPIL